MSLELIKKYNVSAKKSLGQNFLVDDVITTDISQLINIMGSNIVEVGPGYGVLTEKILSQKPQALHLVELDKDMVSILESRKREGDLVIGETDFQILNRDVLEYIPDFEQYSVLANIPYYITSPILRHFIYDVKYSPKYMCILMQKDVGDKILGKGKSKSSVLSLFVEKKYTVQEKIFVPKESFVPQPKVESSVLFFEKHDLYNDIDNNFFLKIIKIGFSEPRKKLVKNLVKGGYNKEEILDFFSKNNLSENIRGEDLSISKWCQLSEYILHTFEK